MAIKKFVELHPTDDPAMFRGGAMIQRSDGRVPVFAGGIKVLEVAGRTDGPWANRIYDDQTDTWSDPAAVNVSPPTLRERLIGKDKAQATLEDIFEAQQEILKSI